MKRALLAAVLAALLPLVSCARPFTKSDSGGPASSGSDQTSPDGKLGSDTLHLREIYVPFEEFRARAAADPSGIIMALEEYRELVLAASRRAGIAPPSNLPPLAAVVLDADHSGVLEGKTARFNSTLRVRVAGRGWVRADLGPALPALGKITVDGKPGWIVIDDGPKPPATRRMHLLLDSPGDHKVEMRFSLPAAEVDERWSLEGPLPAGLAGKLSLDVPGLVEAQVKQGALETSAAGDRTRLLLGLGNADRFKIEWRRKRTSGDQAVFLSAEHRVSYLPRRESPSFVWDVRVTVARRKTDELVFREPPGARVLSVISPLVRSWERTTAGLRLVLKEPLLGEIPVRFSGVLEGGGPRYRLELPRLEGAFADTGCVAVFEADGDAVTVTAVEDAREAAPGEAEPPPIQAAAAGTTAKPPLRLYTCARSGAAVTVEVAQRRLRFEHRSMYLARVGEGGAWIEGLVQVNVREGRLHELSLLLPAPWRLMGLSERAVEGRVDHAVRFDEVAAPEGRRALVHIDRAAEPSRPLELLLQLEDPAFGEERGWGRRDLAVSLPVVEGVERARSDLAVAIPPSMDALLLEVPGWAALSPEETAELGFESTLSAAGAVLTAGLTTAAAAPRLQVTLVRRAPRGEYRAVSHVLALERALRVRSDLRIALLDRPVDELVFRLPPAAGPSAVIAGEGIKEVVFDAVTGRRTLRFARPWLGTRQFRVEYETPHDAGTAVPVPSIAVEASGALLPGERFIVLQSLGAVAIEIAAGPGLAPADADELPDFAEPWRAGRLLTAHRFQASGDPGTLRTEVHERAPVLRSLAREMNLATVIGREGVARTRADILLAHSREQYLRILLPAGAQRLSVSVNGEPIRAVRPDVSTGPQAGNEFSVPLPPQSYARVALIYEERGPALGARGSWTAVAPRLAGVAVGETRWSIYHPDGYRFAFADPSGAKGGNVRSLEPPESIPILSSLYGESPSGERAGIPDLTPEEIRDNRLSVNDARQSPQAGEPPAAQGLLRAAPVGGRGQPKTAAPLVQMIPEGRRIRATKLGGDAVAVLEYRAIGWGLGARLVVFLAVLAAGAALVQAGRWRAFWRFVLGGLFAGVLVPYVLGWHSPLLLVPVCEALAVLAIAGGAFFVVEKAVRRRPSTALKTAVLVILAVLTASGAAMGGEKSSIAPAVEIPARPGEGVLIPYDPASLSRSGELQPGRVYLPYAKFRELWSLAHPEEAAASGPPQDLVLGNAEYVLRVEGESYRIRGTVAFNILADRWVAVPLPFDRAQMAGVAVDGVETGIALKDGVPFIELHGPGARTLTFDLVGAIRREPGLFKVLCPVIAGPAASLSAELPAGAKLEVPRSLAGGAAASSIALDLGSADRLELAWSFERIEGETGSQVESRSYSLLSLTLDGYAVDRRERVAVGGRAVDALTYRVLGGLQVTEVAGSDLSEWSVLRDAGGDRLQVFFRKLVASADLRIKGRAALGTDGPLATLALVGAARQETFIGLHHGAGRRFGPDVLSGMRRASREELAAAFTIPDSEAPDRVYHVYGTGEGQRLAAAPVTGEATITSDLHVQVEVDRLVLSGRSRYSVSGPGPLRHQVMLPGGWTVRSVRCAQLRDWQTTPAADGSQRLVAELSGRAVTGTEIVWTAERPRLTPADPIELPPARTEADAGILVIESQEWVVAADEPLELEVRAAERMVPVQLDTASRWVRLPAGSSPRFAFRSARAEPGGPASGGPASRLVLAASRRPSLLTATVVLFARLEEESLHLNARVIHRVRLSGRDRFRLRLPPGAELESVETRNQRGRDVRAGPAGTEVDVVLQSPVTGEQVIDISYRVARGRGAPATVQPIVVFDGNARLADVDQYVGVLRASAAVLAPETSAGLTKVEPETLPYVPEGVSAQGLGSTFRATQLDWSLTLREDAIELREEMAAVIELAELDTVIGGDGTARTRVAYALRNRRLQFLEVELPEGAELWGVTLNGKPQAAGEIRPAAGAPAGGRVLRIPVERVGAAGMDLEVTLQYEERRLDLPAFTSRAALQGPRVRGVDVLETIWTVQAPDGYRVSSRGSNLREVPFSAQYARKVENLLQQMQKIEDAAKGSESRRVRDQAAKELARLELALGDNLAELESTNRGTAEEAQAGRLGEDDLRKQWADNDRLIQQSNEARQNLRQAREARQKREQEKAPEAPSKTEQSFQDAANYMRRGWRGGKDQQLQAQPGAQQGAQQQAAPPPAPQQNTAAQQNPAAQQKTAPPAAPDGGVSLRDLLEPAAAGGPRFVPLQPRESDHEVAVPHATEPATGLKPLPPELGAGVAPGLEVPPETKGPQAADQGRLTFLRQGGDPELRLSFTKRDAWPRLAGLAALFAVPAALVWFGRRRRRAAL